MVTGGPAEPLRGVARTLLEERSTAEDGAVVVTTTERPRAVVERFVGGACGVDAAQVAVVDARPGGGDAGAGDAGSAGANARSPSAAASDGDDAGPGWLRRVRGDVEPAALDGAVTAALAWLEDRDVVRRHVLYDSLGTARDEADPDGAYQRAYEVAMTVGAEDGLALFALEDAVLPPAVVEKLGHLFDVHLELRGGEGTTEVRWTGLLGASDGWVGLSDVDLGVGGFR